MNLLSGNDVQTFDQVCGFGPPMSFHKPHNDIDARLLKAMTFGKHLPGFPDPRVRSQGKL